MRRSRRWTGAMTGAAAVASVALSVHAQRPTPSSRAASPPLAAAPLVFDLVVVVDVAQGKVVPDQRVVVIGDRIKTVGTVGAVQVPNGARIVDARGKYLIPGLWDMHTHSMNLAPLFYPLFVANGVTGIRDAWSDVPLDTLVRWRHEILAGTWVGPPRQLLAGAAIDDLGDQCTDDHYSYPSWAPKGVGHLCVPRGDTAGARRVVDSLRAAGANMIKTYMLSRELYFVIAAEARRQGLPFGGHIYELDNGITPTEASDSGASILDHDDQAGIQARCWPRFPAATRRLIVKLRSDTFATLKTCQQLAEQFIRNGTWWVPTLNMGFFRGSVSSGIATRVRAAAQQFWAGRVLNIYAARRGMGRGGTSDTAHLLHPPLAGDSADSTDMLRLAERAGLPILAGTDVWAPSGPKYNAPGFTLHAELAMLVAEGLTPLSALRAATLNPAKMLHATDSLGTVAPGKLADLVLLDANPLVNIANTTAIRAVVANGRYFDRVALDRLLTQAQAAGQRIHWPVAP